MEEMTHANEMDFSDIFGDRNPYKHQLDGHAALMRAIDEQQYRCICMTAPCRAGKTMNMAMLTRVGQERGLGVVIYVNRVMIVDQTAQKFSDCGIEFGIRSAGHNPALLKDVQIASVQTETSRVFKRGKRELHQSGIVIMDEMHLMGGKTYREIIRRHLEAGAIVVGFTATPLNLPPEVELLIAYAKNSDLRKCGAHVPALTYGCAEFDTKHIKRLANGEFSPLELKKVYKVQQIFGYVADNLEKYNKDKWPGVMFAPGCPESLFLTQQFEHRGIPVAHVEAKMLYFNKACPKYAGETFQGDVGKRMRQEMMAMSRCGDLRLISSRYVLRESIDCPEWRVCVAATPFGSPASYIQSCSRILTACPTVGKKFALLLDHGGSWHRPGLGSINADRVWELGQRGYDIVRLQEQRRIMGEEPEAAEPQRCPNCQAIRGMAWNLQGKCPQCGFMFSRSIRPVIQKDGSLRLLEGRIYKQRKICKKSRVDKDWQGIYFAARKCGMTFLQAEAYFAKLHHWQYPPRGMPLMPRTIGDWMRKVKDVPFNRLYSEKDSPWRAENPLPPKQKNREFDFQ